LTCESQVGQFDFCPDAPCRDRTDLSRIMSSVLSPES
jgi:hypothetical protein